MMMRLRWIHLLVLLSSAACAGDGLRGAVDAVATEDLRVSRGVVRERLLLSGELTAEEGAVLTAPNVNIWPLQIRWLAADGTAVQAGERVVEFDSSQLASNLEELRLRVVEAANNLAGERARAASEEAQARFAVEKARAELEKARIDAAIPAGLLAELQHAERQLAADRAALELEKAERTLASKQAAAAAQLEIMRIALAEAESEVSRAIDNVNRLTLRAPGDGVLLIAEDRNERRTFQVGDRMWPGNIVARLPDLTTMIAEARLFDVDDGRLVAEQPVLATLDAFPDQPLEGRVRSIGPLAEQQGRESLRRFFRVRIDLEGIDTTRMLPGMSVRIEALVEGTEEGLLVPRASLAWGDDGVHARRADGSWAAVRLGPCDALLCVLEDGLAAGTALALAREVEG